MINEDDDNKRRRNLVTFAVLVCFTHLYGVDLSELIGKALPLRSPIAPWKIYVSGMVINFYLALRYAVRDHTKATQEFLLHWPDWDAIRTAIPEAIKHFLDRRALAEAALLNRDKKPFTTVFTSDVEAEITEKAFAHVAEIERHGPTHGNYTPVTPERLRDEWERAVGVAAAQRTQGIPSGAMQAHAQFTRKSDGRMFQVYSLAQYRRRSPMRALLTVRAVGKVLLASRLALEVLLPYYLAAAAAVLMTLRFAPTAP